MMRTVDKNLSAFAYPYVYCHTVALLQMSIGCYDLFEFKTNFVRLSTVTRSVLLHRDHFNKKDVVEYLRIKIFHFGPTGARPYYNEISSSRPRHSATFC